MNSNPREPRSPAGRSCAGRGEGPLGWVTVPRWLLEGLVDCHQFPRSERCEYVTEARRTLAEPSEP